MLLAAPLALLLIAGLPEEGRGTAGTSPEEAVSLRTSGRLRLGLGGGALFGLSSYTPALGLGFTMDLGIVISDRLAMFLHGELGTVVVTLIGGGGLVVEYALGDHFTAGVGASLSLWGPLAGYGGPGFIGVTFPIRLNFAPVARTASETRRSGLMIGLQVAPGVSVQPTVYFQSQFPIPPEPGFSATVSVGYAWW